MMNDFRFALYSIKKNIQGSAELRSSFLLNVFGMALNDIAFIFLWTFFVHSVGTVGGWTSIDIVGLLGFSAFSYGAVLAVTAFVLLTVLIPWPRSNKVAG